jgi:hypothetical protein
VTSYYSCDFFASAYAAGTLSRPFRPDLAIPRCSKRRDNREVLHESEVGHIRTAMDRSSVEERCVYARHALIDSQNGTRGEGELWKVD